MTVSAWRQLGGIVGALVCVIVIVALVWIWERRPPWRH